MTHKHITIPMKNVLLSNNNDIYIYTKIYIYTYVLYRLIYLNKSEIKEVKTANRIDISQAQKNHIIA